MTVDVVLKPEILDPQGQAIAGALQRLGIEGVRDVRQGKHFELEVDDGVDDDTIAKLDNIATDLDKGNGTAGKLLKDPSLFDNLNSTLKHANSLMADADAGRVVPHDEAMAEIYAVIEAAEAKRIDKG